LARTLSGLRSAHCEIVLANRRAADATAVEARYTLEIGVPDLDDLDAIDAAFQAHLAVPNVTSPDIQRFDRATGGRASARPYASALADYVFTVIDKSRDPAMRSTDAPETNRKRLERSLAELQEWPDRPLPRAVADVIRLNLNDFSSVAGSTGSSDLDTTNGLFADIAAGRASPRVPSADDHEAVRAACPIDQVTDRVVRAATALVAGEEISPNDAGDLELRARSVDSPYDESKLLVLASMATNRRRDRQLREDVLRRLAHDHIFGPWARGQLRNKPE